MDVSNFFFERYDPLYNFWFAGIWEVVPYPEMRERPHPQVNSIAWNLWHLTRCEDAGLNRLVVDRRQVLDDAPWAERMNIPWRHHGSEMTRAEVDELSQRIDLSALYDYAMAVQLHTREIVSELNPDALGDLLAERHVRKVVIDEGLARSDPEGFIANYTGWTKSKCLFNLGLTHAYQHVGKIGVIATLLGVEFD